MKRREFIGASLAAAAAAGLASCNIGPQHAPACAYFYGIELQPHHNARRAGGNRL